MCARHCLRLPLSGKANSRRRPRRLRGVTSARRDFFPAGTTATPNMTARACTGAQSEQPLQGGSGQKPSPSFAAATEVSRAAKEATHFDVTMRVTRIGQTRRASRGPGIAEAFIGTDTSKLRNAVAVAESVAWTWRGRSLSRRDRYRGSGDAPARRQTCN
jgi:hypothetical protein